MKPISLILLTVGRTNYLQECLKSLARQTRKPARLVLVNDGLQLPPAVIEFAQSSAPDVTFVETASPRSGQWRAFRAGLKGLQDHYPFALVHDDDRLKSHYIETLSAFAAAWESPWICSHNLEVLSEGCPSGGRILPSDTLPLKFTSREEVCLR